VSAGYYHTCAILDNGDMKCWGYDNYGQLGNGGTITARQTSPPSTAIDLGTGRTAVAVSAGKYHTCAILDNGDLKCWGYDHKGQLGNGGTNTDTDAPSSTPIDLGTGRTAVAVSAWYSHTCAILDNGDLKCWGRDTTDSWAMVEATRTPTHLHPQRLTSARAERPLRCLLELTTPAPSLTTAT
jgi:alpha-tubulin suppressor-like RCC1 family protein